eukprot:992343-Prorocentrum_minimum.AAC.1
MIKHIKNKFYEALQRCNDEMRNSVFTWNQLECLIIAENRLLNERESERGTFVGLDTDITPLLRRSATGKFDSPPKCLRTFVAAGVGVWGVCNGDGHHRRQHRVGAVGAAPREPRAP